MYDMSDETKYEALRDLTDQPCQYFAACTNKATHTQTLPFGEIPTCDRCAEKIDRLRNGMER